MTFVERIAKRIAYEILLRGNFLKAHPIDVDFCYRLFLHRMPTPEEAAYWYDAVDSQRLTIDNVVDSFVRGKEFQAVFAERNAPRFVEVDGIAVQARPNDFLAGRALFTVGQYEPHVTRMLQEQLSAGMTFVDIGANIGFFSLIAAKAVGETGRVIAFEPNPENCNMLNASVVRNQFGNVTLHQVAVGAEPGTLILDADSGTSNGRIVFERVEGQTLYDVPCIVLDELLHDVERVDIIKMDIEGAEPLAWRGMQQLIKKHRPRLFIEFNPPMIALIETQSAADFLHELQAVYDFSILEDDGTLTESGLSHDTIMQRTAGRSHLDLYGTPK